MPLGAFLFLLLRSTETEAVALAAPVVNRFSGSSLIAVTALVSTGLLNSIFLVGGFRALLTSTYGQILVAKLIVLLRDDRVRRCEPFLTQAKDCGGSRDWSGCGEDRLTFAV